MNGGQSFRQIYGYLRNVVTATHFTTAIERRLSTTLPASRSYMWEFRYNCKKIIRWIFPYDRWVPAFEDFVNDCFDGFTFQLSCLREELLQTWTNNSGSVILFSWIGFLQNETLTFLDIRSPLSLSSSQTLQIVLEHDRNKQSDVFDRKLFSCQVCLSDVPGTACMQFAECGHVFCRTCLRNFFELYIADGAINLLKCPEDKCETQAHPNQVD